MDEILDIEDIVYCYLYPEDTCIQPHNMIELEHPFEMSSETYLKFAKEDLNDGGNEIKCAVNALSNAKRAIESRIDAILHIYGIKKINQKIPGLNSFSNKLDLLGKMGIVAPKILKTVNTVRNRVEHKYERPEPEVISEYVDIAELFLEATQVSTKRFINEFSLESETIGEYWLDFTYDFKKAVFNIEINYFDNRDVEKYTIGFDRNELSFNNRFLELFEIVYKVTLDPPYKK